jgi:hypothetical protein
MKRDDALWKQPLPEGISEDLKDDFMRFFVPNADEFFDLTRFEFFYKESRDTFSIQRR